jgi:hypothetical protein
VSDLGFIVTAWGGTAAVLVGYVAWISARVRQAERSLPPEESPR